MKSFSGLMTERLMKGDQEVLMELFDEYYGQFIQYALQTLKSTSIAEAVVEETFDIFLDQRASLDLSRSLEDQLFEVLVKQVLKTLRKISADPKLKEEIWKCIKKIQHQENEIVLPVERNSLLKVIHNNFLQQQLLNELATTRR